MPKSEYTKKVNRVKKHRRKGPTPTRNKIKPSVSIKPKMKGLKPNGVVVKIKF